LHRSFLPVLEDALFSLWPLLPHGAPVGILSGGAYVDRPITPGDRHATGTAFDLSGFRWVGIAAPWELVRQWRDDPGGALAVEAHLRRTLPQVLGPWYDRAHRDHWHVDDREDARGFQARSGSDVRFLQASLIHVWGRKPGPVDGKLKLRTKAAVVRALDEIEQAGDLTDPGVWDAWLAATARGGLLRVEEP